MISFILFIFLNLNLSMAQDSMTCISLEGVPLPECKFTRYHTCNSGGPGACIYSKVRWMIQTIEEPATGLCANNNMTCNTTCFNGPDGRVCSETCQCNDPNPVPTACNQVCHLCRESTPIHTGVRCNEDCGNPRCPYAFNHNGDILIRVAPGSMPTCQGNSYCAGGTSDPNAPSDPSECPDLPPPEVHPFNADYCCFEGDNPPSYAAHLPRCGTN